jgi:hypothetical protein
LFNNKGDTKNALHKINIFVTEKSYRACIAIDSPFSEW